MRTARFNGHLYRGMSAWVSVCPGGVSVWVVSAQVGVHPLDPEADTPPPDPEADTLPLWTEWQTGVKTLPSRNFLCGR